MVAVGSNPIVAGTYKAPSAKPGAPAPPNFADQLTGANRDAFVALNSLFSSYGLATLAPKIFSYIQNGYSADTIALLLQDTAEYKTRFAGNELRKKQGLPVLNPADYLATEASYRQIMASAGLPKSFYDSPSDYATWIGGDVSPTEIKSRVDLATAATTAADPYLKQQMAAFYGVDDAHLTAYFLDQTKALPLLQKQEAAAQFGAEAARRGLLSDPTRMMDYVNQGFSQSQASQGFQQVADELPNLQALAQRFGYDLRPDRRGVHGVRHERRLDDEEARPGLAGAGHVRRQRRWRRIRPVGRVSCYIAPTRRIGLGRTALALDFGRGLCAAARQVPDAERGCAEDEGQDRPSDVVVRPEDAGDGACGEAHQGDAEPDHQELLHVSPSCVPAA
jgi:hypothetical protein